jgi:hypothetical protein
MAKLAIIKYIQNDANFGDILILSFEQNRTAKLNQRKPYRGPVTEE